jgi:hypothetical protein
MLTARPLHRRRLGVPSTAQASRMRGRRHAAANHFQHVSASTAQSLLPAKGRRGARVAAAMAHLAASWIIGFRRQIRMIWTPGNAACLRLPAIGRLAGGQARVDARCRAARWYRLGLDDIFP